MSPTPGVALTPSVSRDPVPTDADAATIRHNIRRAGLIGGWCWAIFTLLDLYMCLALYPEAPFALFIAYRIVVEALILWIYRETGRPSAPLARLMRLQDLLFVLAALTISLMAIHLGGIRSVYVHGVSIVCLVRATLRAEHWRRSLLNFVVITLTFPAVMVAVAIVDSAARAEWFSGASLAVFLANYIFLVASAIVGMSAGHAMWAARQQVYRARRLGRYRLQAPIGKGGMGEVWLAWDGSLRRNVALKILRTAGPPDASSVRRFEREAQNASRLRVPHTIQVFDFGASDDGVYYMAMEFLPGIDLRRLVDTHGPQPPARCVGFIKQACLSLEEAHAAGIIHRDIKPQNLFLTSVGENFDFIKLLDFGIARFRALEDTVELTQSGFVRGTPSFLAPELWRGSTADERSDVYALGGTCYFLLTGFPPFDATAIDALAGAHLTEAPKPLAARSYHAIDPALEAIVLRCLAKSPEDRFASARDLYRALDDLTDLGSWSPDDARAFWQRAGLATTT